MGTSTLLARPHTQYGVKGDGEGGRRLRARPAGTLPCVTRWPAWTPTGRLHAWKSQPPTATRPVSRFASCAKACGTSGRNGAVVAAGEAAELSPTCVRVMLANLSSILLAAVDDGLIARNPCRAKTVRAPAVERKRVQPWPRERVIAVTEALPARYRATAVVAAGAGLRQGEVFGLAVEDVDFLRGWVHMQRQVKLVNSRLVFGSPNGRKIRDVALAESVALQLAAHIAKYPPRLVTLPWEEPDGELRQFQLIFTTRELKALNRTYDNRYLWKPTLEKVGVERRERTGRMRCDASTRARCSVPARMSRRSRSTWVTPIPASH